LTDSAIRRTVLAPSSGDWRTIEVAGASVLSVLGIASSAEEVLSNVPRTIMEFASRDTLSSELSPRVLIAAAIDPSLQTVATQAIPLVRFIALCADRPKGEPKAGDRRLCDALGVPFDGPDAIGTVTSDIPTLLMSSGFDAQTPMELAADAAKTLSHSQHVNFPTAGHVAVSRPLVAPCVALIVDSFLRAWDQPVPANCAGRLVPAFMPPER
jgi:pimeloyl-ACP methyl ester carboxylesterase